MTDADTRLEQWRAFGLQWEQRTSMPIITELDALLDRVREDKADTTGKNRNTVAYDCWCMFEDLATRYKEEFAMRDRYKAQSNGWRDKALELNERCCELLEMVKYLRNYARLADLAPDTAAKLDALIEKGEKGL